MSFQGYEGHTDGLVRAGDYVVLFVTPDISVMAGPLTKGKFTQFKAGRFPHDLIIGKAFGTQLQSMDKKGSVILLFPTPELWTTLLKHRTQILYDADISAICLQLNLHPGAIVIETGTGSGSLTHALARTVMPNGHVHTFEYHAGRAQEAKQEFNDHGLEDIITVTNHDVYAHGFALVGVADAVFLDLPAPWDALNHATVALKPSIGRLCSFSPCMEQVQRMCDMILAAGYSEVTTIEVLTQQSAARPGIVPLPPGFQVPESMKASLTSEGDCVNSLISREFPTRGHTGFLTFATAPRRKLEAKPSEL